MEGAQLLLSVAIFLFSRDVNSCYLFFDNFRSRPEFTSKPSKKAKDGSGGKDSPRQGGGGAASGKAGAPASKPPSSVVDGVRSKVPAVQYLADRAGSIDDDVMEALEFLNPLRMGDVLYPLLRWANSHFMPCRALGQLVVCVTCVMLLNSRHPLQVLTDAAAGLEGDTPPPPLGLAGATWDEIVAATADPQQAEELMSFLELHGYLNYTVICVPLAFGVFCWALAFSQVMDAAVAF